MATGTQQQHTGRRAEEEALRHLESNGLTLIDRNFHCRWGEIDLVLSDGQTIVFVEVRYRRQTRFGGAAESVDARKQRRLVLTAEYYIQRHPRWSRSPARFDIVAIEEPRRIEWIKNAFGS